MTVEIKVPPLGESVTEATVAKLYKAVGEYVNTDEIILELETEKVTLEVNALSSGVLEKLSISEGDVVEEGKIIGSIDDKAKNPNGNTNTASSKPADTTKSLENTSPNTTENIYSPAAKKIATENNIQISSGTGKDGRITKDDVLSNIASPSQPAKKEERVKMTKLRLAIANRLKDSQNTAAILTTFNEVDMTNVISLRKKYQDVFVKKNDIKLGFMSFFIKASIKALKDIPAVNAEIDGNEIVYKNYYDISVAMGTPQGLVVPVVRNADNLSFSGVEKAIIELGNKAKKGGLTMSDMKGGTFTISNGGTYGSLLSTPIINPPQTGILGLHNIQERPMVVNGEIVIRPMMYIALSYDHRLIDGSEAVTFLVKIKQAIEDPQRLLLDI